MSAKKDDNGSPLSWRDINQSRRKRPTTSVARQRKWNAILKATIAAFVVVLVGSSVLAGVMFGRPVVDKIQVQASTQPLRTISFVSDGVLSTEWFNANFPDVRGNSPLNVDIHGIKRVLEANGQIRSAEVAIALPDTLHVRIQERQPVLRARLLDVDGTIKTLMISRDGTVYDGHGYPPQMVRRLPAAADLRLRRSESGYMPVSGMEMVADLFDHAKLEVPHLFRHWHAVHFNRIQEDTTAPDTLIKISSRNVDTIIFAPSQFEDQLMRLNEVVNYTLQEKKPGLRSVDLSFREQAIVQFN